MGVKFVGLKGEDTVAQIALYPESKVDAELEVEAEADDSASVAEASSDDATTLVDTKAVAETEEDE